VRGGYTCCNLLCMAFCVLCGVTTRSRRPDRKLCRRAPLYTPQDVCRVVERVVARCCWRSLPVTRRDTYTRVTCANTGKTRMVAWRFAPSATLAWRNTPLRPARTRRTHRWRSAARKQHTRDSAAGAQTHHGCRKQEVFQAGGRLPGQEALRAAVDSTKKRALELKAGRSDRR